VCTHDITFPKEYDEEIWCIAKVESRKKEIKLGRGGGGGKDSINITHKKTCNIIKFKINAQIFQKEDSQFQMKNHEAQYKKNLKQPMG
jgi:hypothetical protein